MLWFNPETRITAEEALKDPYFDEVRIPEQETSLENELADCDIDRKLQRDTEELSTEELRKLILEEIEACPQSL